MAQIPPRDRGYLPVDKLGRKSRFFKDFSNKKRAKLLRACGFFNE